jgi:hypothetical protein
MNFTHYDLGQRQRGEIVEVTLTNGANVRLMSDSDFRSYKAGRAHRYHGGLVRTSPFRQAIPSNGRWHLTVDVQGLRNGTKSSIRFLPPPLRALPEVALATVPSLLREPAPRVESGGHTYDVFISHASEDKDAIVRPLAEALTGLGLDVWYDEFTLRIGDSLRRKIDRGLASSRVGLVVLSPHFINKGWTNYELDGIVSRSVSGEQILLPIWHDITKQQVLDYSPSLADKVARSTATHTVEEIAAEIAELIHSGAGNAD